MNNYQGWKIPHTDFITGMCMGCDKCGENLLTCHRWMPNVSTPDLRPMPYQAPERWRLYPCRTRHLRDEDYIHLICMRMPYQAPERWRLYPLDMHENDRGRIIQLGLCIRTSISTYMSTNIPAEILRSGPFDMHENDRWSHSSHFY
jgi:hypothetical protein